MQTVTIHTPRLSNSVPTTKSIPLIPFKRSLSRDRHVYKPPSREDPLPCQLRFRDPGHTRTTTNVSAFLPSHRPRLVHPRSHNPSFSLSIPWFLSNTSRNVSWYSWSLKEALPSTVSKPRLFTVPNWKVSAHNETDTTLFVLPSFTSSFPSSVLWCRRWTSTLSTTPEPVPLRVRLPL